MKVVLELTQDEALALATELHKAAVRRRKEAIYRTAQGEPELAAPLTKRAKLFRRLSSELERYYT